MNPRFLRLAGVAALAALIVLAPTPATAQAGTPTGNGSVGSAYAFSESPAFDVDIDPLAPCTVGAVNTASTSGAGTSDFVTFGWGRSGCTTDTAGAVKVEVTGRKFRLTGLKPFGGPMIKISQFTVSCATETNGSQANISINGLSGIQVPNPIPTNHVVTIAGAQPTSPPVARIVLNELIVPDPPDGSMTVNLMRVQLFPEGIALAHGEVVVGTVHCSPRG